MPRKPRTGPPDVVFDEIVGGEDVIKDVPQLEAPPEVDVRPSGGCSDQTSTQLNADLDTSMPAESLMAHYSQQVEALGWSMTAVVSTAPWRCDRGRSPTAASRWPDYWSSATVVR